MFNLSSLPNTRGTHNTLTRKAVVLVLIQSDMNHLCIILWASESVMSRLGTDGAECDPALTVLSCDDPVFLVFGVVNEPSAARLDMRGFPCRQELPHVHTLSEARLHVFLGSQIPHDDTSFLGCSTCVEAGETKVLKYQTGVLR